MSAAPQIRPQPLMLSIVGGPDKGVQYKVHSEQISIGRETDNDITLNDPKCSRHHAVIMIQNGNLIEVKDLGSQHGVMVKGQKIMEAVLNIGDKFVVGSTTFLIHTPEENNLIEKPKPTPSPATIMSHSKKDQEPSSKMGFYAVVTFIGIALIYLITKSPSNKNNDYGLHTEQQADAEIQSVQKQKDDLARQKLNEGVFSRQYEEAQAAYIQGFRDYREANYSRAMQYFGAALALFPNHSLAQKYLRLSERKLDELIQFNMLQGKKYREQNKFELSRDAYRNVLTLLNDPKNKMYIEASERIQEIELNLKGRY